MTSPRVRDDALTAPGPAAALSDTAGQHPHAGAIGELSSRGDASTLAAHPSAASAGAAGSPDRHSSWTTAHHAAGASGGAPGSPERDAQQQDDQSDLPPAPQGFEGTHRHRHKGKFDIAASNANGYLCRVTTDGRFECPPHLLFTIFTNPDNTGVFRDIKGVGGRKLLREEPGRRLVEVEQLGEVRLLWVKVPFSTVLTVDEDQRDPEHLVTTFKLVRSGVLRKFNGRWDLRPLRDGAGQVVACHAQLEQDILPAGMPSFLAHVPVLGGALRKTCIRAVTRLIEDTERVVAEVNRGVPLSALLKPVDRHKQEKALKQSKEPELAPLPPAGGAGSAAAAEQQRQRVASFAIDDLDDEDDK